MAAKYLGDEKWKKISASNFFDPNDDEASARMEADVLTSPDKYSKEANWFLAEPKTRIPFLSVQLVSEGSDATMLKVLVHPVFNWKRHGFNPRKVSFTMYFAASFSSCTD
jgi:hypothetical protein